MQFVALGERYMVMITVQVFFFFVCTQNEFIYNLMYSFVIIAAIKLNN